MPKEKTKCQNDEMVIVVDTRETLAYTFANIKPRPEIIYKKLDSGDYSLLSFENKVTIERKEKNDLFSSFGRNRNRLQKEFERLSQFQYAGLVIECNLSDIFKNPPARSRMNPKSVFRSLISWSVYYGVHIWTAPDRAFSEKLTYLILEFWWKKNVEQI